MDSFQDSPTIGRRQILTLGGSQSQDQGQGYTTNSPLTTPSSTISSRSTRKPAPSPLHTSSAVSPPTSPGPARSGFPSPLHQPYTVAAVPRIVTTAAPEDRREQASEKTYFISDSSGATTPEERSPGPAPSPLSQRFPNEARSVSDPVVTPKPPAGPPLGSSTMAGSSSVRAELATGAPRNSSMDSAISAISAKSTPSKGSQGNAVGTTDIANLIKTAGSPEAVIQYLLKEKQSQSQQNAQLWRLVDKQRAMILGLNKDLERALKDKEKYRKKLKEFVLEAGVPPVPPVPTGRAPGPNSSGSRPVDSPPKEQVLEIPASPGLDSDSQKHSPIDVSLAPYPITPPADQPGSNRPSPTVAEILDPSHTMPKPSEHALNQFDHDAQEREADAARKEAEEAKDLHLNLGIPPSRTLPREPPRIPPPLLPAASIDLSPGLEEGIAQFPPPPAPPPRKPPPAPLHLKNIPPHSPLIPADEEPDSDTDYDDILEVDEIPVFDQRGRRRTREEDEREREILARKEAEIRSLSKKSKSGSEKGAPKDSVSLSPKSEMPVSPRLFQVGKAVPQRAEGVSSLDGVLSGTSSLEARSITMPLLSPGLPSSPRPIAMKSPVNSPPLSPLGVLSFGAPLSPRPPRVPIPLPPNTPLQTPSPAVEPLLLTSPKPLNIIKKSSDSIESSSPTKSNHSSPTARKRVFKGLVTDEYPDLLLPPNALPSIDIKVASSRMKPSRASLLSMTQLEEDPVFTLAIFSRSDSGEELWRVEKDSASLAKLDQRLKQCQAFTARTPDRSLFSGHAPAKLDARRVALNQYLDELLNTPLDNATALELCKYLSTNTLPPNADETGSSPSVVNPAEPDQKTGPGGRPFRSGYLTKRGKNFGGWKARFFILDGPHLKYYETPGGAHLGTIKLPRAQIGKQSHNTNEGSPAPNSGVDDVDNQYRHAFLILEPKKKDPNSLTKHVLCAESDRERDQWVEALLRWIDYREPGEEDPPKKEHAHDRQGSGGSERVNGVHGKKKLQGRQPQPSESDASLIGVQYEATKQGDIPQGAPAKSKQSGYHEHEQSQGQTITSQSSYTISAPRDAHVISNSESWGSKLGMGLAPPNQEEKKARKRSFFGFGPKTRPSGDGPESLFGNDGGAGANGQAGNPFNNGPVRQVFGASLGEAVRYNAPADVRVPLPAVVYRCIQYLEAKGAISEEGIFRLSGSNVVIKALKERFNTEGDINLLAEEQYHDIHAVASLLKAYLRELPTSILTRDLHVEFMSVTEMTNQREKIFALSELVQRLPQANATLLKYLIAFLIKIINNSDTNKMTVRNVGIVFSPTLNIPAPVFAMFLQNYEPVFGIDPIEYELPVTESYSHERRPSLPMDRPPFQQERRPSDGRSDGRPSTSHSDSPHRQRLMEAVMEGQVSRNTPTPPPVMSMQQMAQMNAAAQLQSRSTPTPPPQRPINYDAQFYSQQNQAGSHVSMRPAYESGFVVPQGYEAAPMPANSGYKQNPGYDRPLYENSGLAPAPYDQPYKNRRESTMFMGNLAQQGSKGRLREEGQF
ncbi:hypothetical protein B0T17DRAFT_250804 [Bombardia bombarda]|uniref:Uncharacterized protein n=1 Tax=Bombardia bombarda TaxID=252184 RepID=A0AA39X052_9PEZI|nr:hypothetical protein B0T17DRAFT_250804 [Bombardia bombarda]